MFVWPGLLFIFYLILIYLKNRKNPYLCVIFHYMSVWYKIIAVIFALFALVQYNDPDPVQWMLIYGGVSLNATLMVVRKPVKVLIWVFFLVSGLWCLSLFPHFLNWLNTGCPSIVTTMKAEKPWVELTREFLGLLLAFLANGWLLWNLHTSK